MPKSAPSPQKPQVVFHPNLASYDESRDSRYRDFLSGRRRRRVDGWSCKKTAKPGDVYLFWFCKELEFLGGIGVVSGDPCPDNDWGQVCDFRPVVFFDHDEAVTTADIEKSRILAQWWHGRPFQGGPKEIKKARVRNELIRVIGKKSPQKAATIARLLGEQRVGNDSDSAPQDRPTRYWLFLVMAFDGLWRLFVKKSIAAHHYPEGWSNEKPNVSRLAQMRRGDQIIAAFGNHRFAGFGTLLTDFARRGPSLNIRGSDGRVFRFAERFGCAWTCIPPDQSLPWINCHDLRSRGYAIDLQRGRAVKEIDRDSFNAIKKALMAAGAVAGKGQRRPTTLRRPKRRNAAIGGVAGRRVASLAGAGFEQDPERREKVEAAGRRAVTKHYQKEGWTVRVVENENRGYDLECRKGRKVLHVEVKAATGCEVRFPITANEVRQWEQDQQFVLAFVPDALSKSPQPEFFPHAEQRRFEFPPISFAARLKCDEPNGLKR